MLGKRLFKSPFLRVDELVPLTTTSIGLLWSQIAVSRINASFSMTG